MVRDEDAGESALGRVYHRHFLIGNRVYVKAIELRSWFE